MQVEISVPGSFHAFTLGRQLEDRQSLRQIYTTYPKFATDKKDFPDGRVTHIRYPEVIAQLGHRFPILNDVIPSRWNEPFNRWKGVLFDKSVSRKLESIEDGLFLGFAGVSLESLKRANELGLTTVVERSSVHIRVQKNILNEEYSKYNQGKDPISKHHIRREEQEYEVSDYIVVPSKFAKDSFIKEGFDNKKIKNIPLGYNHQKNNTTKNRQGKETIYLFAGAVDLQKGVQYLLEAWDMLDLPDAKLLFAGNISENIEELVGEYEKDDTIEFLGWVDNIGKIYNKSSVFVLPSIQDGFGIVVTEAMSNGLPVIVSENTGSKDCVREGTDGYVVPTRDKQALVDAMRRMYDNPDERNRMGRAAKEHIQSEYTEDDYGERIISEYQKMISS